MLNTLRIWRDITKHIGRREFSSALQPLTRNKAFPSGIGVTIFDDWFSKDLRFVSDLFENGNFMSFTQIQNRYKVSRNHFFGFLQVRHFVNSNLKLPNDQPMLSPIESFLLHFNLNTLNDKKFIYLFYEKFMPFNSANSDRARDLWEKDLEVELSTEAWSNAFMSAKKIYTYMQQTQGESI